MIPTSKYVGQICAKFLWIGLGNSGPWNSLMVAASKFEMPVIVVRAVTICGGTTFARKTFQIWFMYVSSKQSGTFAPRGTVSAKVNYFLLNSWVIGQRNEAVNSPTFRGMRILKAPGNTKTVKMLGNPNGGPHSLIPDLDLCPIFVRHHRPWEPPWIFLIPYHSCSIPCRREGLARRCKHGRQDKALIDISMDVSKVSVAS